MALGFESGPWLTLALGAFVLGHLLVLAYFLRANADRSGPTVGQQHADPTLDAGAETPRSRHGDVDRETPGDLPPVDSERVIQCSHCGVHNAAEYRYCRFCVGELSDGTSVADPAAASRDGQTF